MNFREGFKWLWLLMSLWVLGYIVMHIMPPAWLLIMTGITGIDHIIEEIKARNDGEL